MRLLSSCVVGSLLGHIYASNVSCGFLIYVLIVVKTETQKRNPTEFGNILSLNFTKSVCNVFELISISSSKRTFTESQQVPQIEMTTTGPL